MNKPFSPSSTPGRHHRSLADLAPETPAEQEAAACIVESESLFQGRKSVQIEHNGALYELRATRLGKLILTK